MQKVTLHALPEEDPWTIDEFIERTEQNCRQAAIELNRRSLMVEEAVEEVVELVRKAAEDFRGESSTIFDFDLDGG